MKCVDHETARDSFRRRGSIRKLKVVFRFASEICRDAVRKAARVRPRSPQLGLWDSD